MTCSSLDVDGSAVSLQLHRLEVGVVSVEKRQVHRRKVALAVAILFLILRASDEKGMAKAATRAKRASKYINIT